MSGLEYFERVGSRSGLGGEVAALTARYESGPALDPEMLHADADTVRSAAATMRAHLLAQEQAIARLHSVWSGTAADAALHTLHRHLDLARADCTTVLTAAAALDEGGALISDAYRARADFVDAVFGDRSDDGEGWTPQVSTTHLISCIAALTELAVAVDGLVEGVRALVDQVVEADADCAPTEPPTPGQASPATVVVEPVRVVEPAPVDPQPQIAVDSPVPVSEPPAAAESAAPPSVSDETGSGALAFASVPGSRGTPGGRLDDAVEGNGTPAEAGTDADLAGAGPL